MPRYHVNPETGEPGLCRAKKACPFGNLEVDHYNTRTEARKEYERRMEDPVQRTIETYNEKVEHYIEGSPKDVSPTMGAWMTESLESLPEGARVVELGSAFGRDAEYLSAQGFDVVVTDAAEGFFPALEEKGFSPRRLDAVKDDVFPYSDAYLANAVLLHFSKPEATRVMEKVAKSLPETGVFAFSLKKGEGEEWSSEKVGSPRFFSYWKPEEVEVAALRAGFSRVTVQEDRVGPVTWLMVTARKEPAPEPLPYQVGHQPNPDGALASDVEVMFPDFYDHPEWYSDRGSHDRETIRVLNRVRGNPDAEVTIYRSLEKEEWGIVEGNWVTLSRTYAENHGVQHDGSEWPVVEKKVRARDIRTPGDSIHEWGYYPSSES